MVVIEGLWKLRGLEDEYTLANYHETSPREITVQQRHVQLYNNTHDLPLGWLRTFGRDYCNSIIKSGIRKTPKACTVPKSQELGLSRISAYCNRMSPGVHRPEPICEAIFLG